MKEFHRFLRPGVHIQACSIFLETFCWPLLKAQGRGWGFGCRAGTLYTLIQSLCFRSSRGGSLLSTDCSKAFLLGWAFLNPAESPLQWSPIAPLNIAFLWANLTPCLLFPTYSVSCALNLHFEVSGFEQSQNLSWNLTLLWQPLPPALSTLGGTICGVRGFKPAISQVSHASLSTESSLQLEQAYEFYLNCCQYFELSVALVGSLLSSRLFPWINIAGWQTELPTVSWHSTGRSLWIRKLNILKLIRERLPRYI